MAAFAVKAGGVVEKGQVFSFLKDKDKLQLEHALLNKGMTKKAAQEAAKKTYMDQKAL